MKGLRLVLIAALLLGCGSSLGYAQETAVKPPGSVSTATEVEAPVKKENFLPIYKEDWQFFVAPYFWMVGVNINVAKQGARGATAAAAVPWYDLVPDYFSKVFGAMGRVEIWKDRWGFFVDNVFIYVGDNASAGGSKEIKSPDVPAGIRLISSGKANVIIRQGFLDVGGRYLLGTLPLSPDKPLPILSCELLGGGRYNWYNQFTSLAVDAALTGPLGRQLLTRSKDFSMPFKLMVVEPFLGLRTGVWFTEKLNLLLRADVGGFGFVACNHIDSNLEALVGYKVHDNIRLEAGYRGRYYSFNKGGEGIKSHGWYHGPVLGAVFSF